MSSSLRLVYFVIGLMNSLLNLPNGQVKFLQEEFKLEKYCKTNNNLLKVLIKSSGFEAVF